jgi:hypothetical protein
MESSTKANHPVLKLVVWDDAWSSGIDVLTEKEMLEKHHPSIMQTLGWVVYSDAAGVSIANERCMDKGDECYRGHTFIPRSLIKSETPFKLTTPRRKRVLNEKDPV